MTKKPNPEKTTVKILIDSNALFIPLQFKLDIFEELKKLLNRKVQTIILSSVLHELQRIANEGSPKARKNAVYALKLAEKCTVEDNPCVEDTATDDLIVQKASKHKYPVFTNDAQLRHRLRDINVPVIYVRNKSRLEIEGRV